MQLVTSTRYGGWIFFLRRSKPDSVIGLTSNHVAISNDDP
jgi:hypothetical protein